MMAVNGIQGALLMIDSVSAGRWNRHNVQSGLVSRTALETRNSRHNSQLQLGFRLVRFLNSPSRGRHLCNLTPEEHRNCSSQVARSKPRVVSHAYPDRVQGVGTDREQQGSESRRAPQLAQSDEKSNSARIDYFTSQWDEYDLAVEAMDLGKALTLADALTRVRSLETAQIDELGVGNGAVDLEQEPRSDGATASSDEFQASSDKVQHSDGEASRNELTFAASWNDEKNPTPVEQSALMRADMPEVEVLQEGYLLSLPRPAQRRYLKLLDAGLVAEDVGLVSQAYNWLRTRGILRSFGQVTPNDIDIPRVVTPATLKELAGVEASKLSPKKWGSANTLGPLLVFAGISALVNNGVDIRPILVVLLSAAIYDAIALGGTGYGQVLSQWKPYKRRILVHEAGHVVTAYLLGCPVRGVVLDAMEAIKLGIQGQAGTQFWDNVLEEELKMGRLTGTTIDRYCIVLFAGIAAEALVYGEAKGGESDENMFKAVLGQLTPAWTPAKISNQARWAVLQAYLLLSQYRTAHEAVVEALDRGAPMGELARAIEEAMAAEAMSTTSEA